MSRRLKITLPDVLAVQLDELAANTGEPAARLAGQMVRHGIAEAAASGKVHPPRAREITVALGAPEEGASDRRPPWLEPYAEMQNGAPGCGAGSSRCTAATPQRLPS
jgi:hypothetical protein